MAHSHEEELARELTRRGLSRREVLKVGLRLGLGATSMGALLAACGAQLHPLLHQPPHPLPPHQPPHPLLPQPPHPPPPHQRAAPADQQGSIFDAAEGAQGPGPKSPSPSQLLR